ncbi:hypothetical protein AB3N59_06820 [Leptospira sp. WS92.C1]
MRFKKLTILSIYCINTLLYSESLQKSLLEYSPNTIKSDKFNKVCAEKEINHTTELTLDTWHNNKRSENIKKDLTNFRSLAACAPELRIIIIRGDQNNPSCISFLRDLDKFNKIYGDSLYKIFPKAAIYYDTNGNPQRDCHPQNKTPNYIGPPNVSELYDYKTKDFTREQCPKKVHDITTLYLNPISMESEPLDWPETLKNEYRNQIANELEKLKGLNDCPHLRTVILNIPVGLYLPITAYNNRTTYDKMGYDKIYKTNLDVFRKKHGKKILELLPNKEVLLNTIIW